MYTTKYGLLAFIYFYLQKQRLNIARLLDTLCHITNLYVLVSGRRRILKSNCFKNKIPSVNTLQKYSTAIINQKIRKLPLFDK